MSEQTKQPITRAQVMDTEADLMKAANEFGKAWGCDQRVHPRAYWLDLHLSRWSELARAALAYAECFDSQPEPETTDQIVKESHE